MSFDKIVSGLPNDSIKFNILYNLDKLTTEESKDRYREVVVKSYRNAFDDFDYLFFQDLYPEIEQIHERISYSKHNRVIRHGVKCKKCGSTNTFSEDKQKGGGDEYIPTEVQCYNCGKRYLD